MALSDSELTIRGINSRRAKTYGSCRVEVFHNARPHEPKAHSYLSSGKEFPSSLFPATLLSIGDLRC
jgi:hypothetical protein